MAEDVRKWLRDIGCEHYHPIFVQNGYNNLGALSGLTESSLTKMAVLNPSHKQAILNKARTTTAAPSAVGTVDFDFDNLLGDLTSAIADLESITAPGRSPSISTNSYNPATYDPSSRRHTVPAGTISGSSSGNSTPLGGGTPYNSLQREEKKPIQGFNPEASLKDTDLDALLSDLCDFDPMKEVQPSQPPMFTNPIQFASPVHQVASTPPLPHQRVFQKTEPSPPPPPTAPRPVPTNKPSPLAQPKPNGVVTHETKESPSHSNSSLPHDLPPPKGFDSTDEVTPVHEPKLTGASEEITKDDIARRLVAREEELRSDPNINDDEVAAKMKDEKMKIAIEKMKIASKKKVAIKVFNNDGSNKTVVVEEGMSAAIICYLLVSKNHFEESPNWTIIERLGDVGLERELEDHECVEEIYTHWARDSNNQFFFRRNDLKYELFVDPIKYFPALLTSTMIGKDSKNRTDKARKILVQEYFTSALRVPEIEGFLHLKDGYKNKWKKIYVILRASGLYQTLKGKAKTAKNLQLLIQFEDCDLYRSLNFKKMLKAPSDFCFGLRPKPDQMVPGAKDIKVLCADSEEEFISWYAGCRLAKFGHVLYDNYYKAHIKQFKLEDPETTGGRTAEERAYSLTGMRLEKHLDKRREEYQREKEAKVAQEMMFKHVGGEDNTPEASPQVPPKTAPKPRVAPKPAPKPSPRGEHPDDDVPPPIPPHPVDEYEGVVLDSLSQYPWYHGSIPRDEAIRRLEQAGSRDGLFLVRDSSSVANSFVLTMFAKSVPKNFQIMPYELENSEIVYRIDDGPQFKSVPEILEHYRNVADRLPCKLAEYCSRPPTRMTEC